MGGNQRPLVRKRVGTNKPRRGYDRDVHKDLDVNVVFASAATIFWKPSLSQRECA